MKSVLFLLLPVAALTGWLVARRTYKTSNASSQNATLPANYYTGVNYLVNEQPDKAIEAFVKVLSLSPESVETTLALGNLFRRRGEVDRAIRIHQNLIARPSLTSKQRSRGLMELGQDYLSAGVYDRAESLFHELSEMGHEEKLTSLQYLIDIYEREQDWDRAIKAAEKRQKLTGVKHGHVIAQYFCEKSERQIRQHNFVEANKFLRSALSFDHLCVRASIMQGRILMQNKQYKAALRALTQVQGQEECYLSEVIEDICTCYTHLGQDHNLSAYLEMRLKQSPSISLVIANAKRLSEKGEVNEAMAFVTNYLRSKPSIRGLSHLISQHLSLARSNDAVQELTLLQDLIHQLLMHKPIYQCDNCGFSGKSLLWHCPSCHQWSSIKPIQGLEGE